jgi:hypothetical protein
MWVRGGFTGGKFLKSKISLCDVVRPTPNPQPDYASSGTYTLTCVTWMNPPGARAPASITLLVVWTPLRRGKIIYSSVQIKQTKQNKLCGLSPLAKLYRPSNRRLSAKLVLTFAHRKRFVVRTTDPCGRILGFLDRIRYFFFQVAPQLYLQGWVHPVPDPLRFRKSGCAGNRTWTSGSVARNTDH